MKQVPLTVTFHIGEQQIEALTEEQLDKMSERLSEAMSSYYTAHPEEYRKIKAEKRGS